MEIPSGVITADPVIRQRSNQRLAMKLGLVAVLFGFFGFGLVPLYDAICRMTGINGRTNAAPAVINKNTQVDLTRWVTVEFLSHSMPGVGLSFKPEQFSMRIHPGAIAQMNYVITNTSDQVFVGQAIPSVTPAVAAPYLEKLECFCFNQQTFAPGESRTVPVVFVINPELRRDMGTMTLSYTFFEAVKAKS